MKASIVNAHRTEAIEATIRANGGNRARSHVLTHPDPFARNTFEAPETIMPIAGEVAVNNGAAKLVLPPHSYTILEISP